MAMSRTLSVMGRSCRIWAILFCCLLCVCGGLGAEESALLNEGFENPLGEGVYSATPKDWIWFGGWGKIKATEKSCGISSDAAAEGTRSLRFAVPPEGVMEGWITRELPRPESGQGLQVSYKTKVSDDMQGLVLQVFITWHDKDGKYIQLGSTHGDVLAGLKPAENFLGHSFMIKSEQIPEGAAKFRLNVAATRSKNAENFSGTIFVDELAVSAVNPPVALVPEKFASWWTIGDTVSFKPEKPAQIPASMETLTGVVFDSANLKQAEVTVTREALLKDGWKWAAPKPGLYEVEFTWSSQSQKQIPVDRFYMVQPRQGKYVPVGDPVKVTRPRHVFAIAARPLRPMKDRSPQFGACEHMGWMETRAGLADLLGLSFVRLCWVDWQYIEPEKGKFNWAYLDPTIDVLKKFGFTTVGTIYGTPRWASSHPDETENYVTPRYSAYAPADIKDWETIVAALVDRYGDYIKEWNIWNEPFSPNGSVYWYDTAENYAKLLVSAYRIIKEKQPDSTVSFAGGATPDVYRVALQSGAKGHYDAIAPHGTWPEPDAVRNAEMIVGVTPTKRWVNLEWHAMLRRHDGNPLDKTGGDEASLSRRVLFDLANQIRNGVEKIGVFEMLNLTEIEELEYERTLNHASGFFRRKPAIEPRLPGVVLYNIVSMVKDRLTYYGEYTFGEQQKAVAFMTGGEPLLMFWSESDNEVDPETALKSLLQKAKEVIDWEGRKHAATGKLAPGVVYFARDGIMPALSSLPKAKGVIVSPRRQRPTTPKDANIPQGYYVNAPLFDQPSGALIEKNIVWNESPWIWTSLGLKQPEGYSARFAVGFTKEGMDVVVEVKDGNNQPRMQPGRYYEGDSVQFGFDTEFQGRQPQSEFQVAGNGKESVIWKTLSGYSGGDLPENYTVTIGKLQYAQPHVTWNNGVTTYRVRLKMGELHPFSYSPDKELRMSFLVNNNDGEGRGGYFAWSGGIGDTKHPGLYGRLLPHKPAK